MQQIMSFPWQQVEKDVNGVTTIHVNDENLRSFPRFMHAVLKEELGLEKGYFKVSKPILPLIFILNPYPLYETREIFDRFWSMIRRRALQL